MSNRTSHRDWKFEVSSICKITDGDTYWLYLDVGFRQVQLTHLRLNDWDTPEIYRPQSDYELERGHEAKKFVVAWLRYGLDTDGIEVWTATEPDPDSFGRWLTTLYTRDVENEIVTDLGKELAHVELATEWPTRWRDVYDV